MRTGPVALVLLTLAACGGSDPSGPDAAVLESLGMTVRVEPSYGVARDTVDVVVTILNEEPAPVTLRGADACIVSSIRVDLGDEPVAFQGGGQQNCPPDGSLTIGAGDSASVRFPLVVWQVPDPDRPGSDEDVTIYVGQEHGQGPPLPRHFRITVHSEVLRREVEAERTLHVLPSGWHRGFAETCETAPPDSVTSGPYIVVQPDLVNPNRTALRVRFEVHALDTGFQLGGCSGEIIAAVDRLTAEGWDLGAYPLICSGGPVPSAIAPGGCLRGVRYHTGYQPGDYRLRIWTRLPDGGVADLVSDVFRP